MSNRLTLMILSNKFFSITIVLIIGFISKSCLFSGCDIKNISVSDKEWLNCYRLNQMITFKNQFGQIDTLIVDEIDTTYSSCNKFELGPNQYQEISISLKSSRTERTDRNNSVYISFSQNHDGNLCSKYFYVYDYHFWDGRDLEQELKDSLLNLKYFKKRNLDCLVFTQKDDNHHDSDDFNLDTFYWNKDYGLIKYIIHDTLEYEIFKIN